MLRNVFALGFYSRGLAAAAICLALGAIAPAAQAQNLAVDQFLANPAQALQQYPNGGPQLISLIRDVALAHPEALQSIIGLLAASDADQQMAIGSGLGQAAQMSLQANPAYANQVQTALVASGFQNAITAFSGVTGNVNIASTGGGGGGGGGGVGGPTGSGSGGPSGGSNSGSGGTTGSGGFQNSGNSFTGGGAGGGTNSGGSNFFGSVSPR